MAAVFPQTAAPSMRPSVQAVSIVSGDVVTTVTISEPTSAPAGGSSVLSTSRAPGLTRPALREVCSALWSIAAWRSPCRVGLVGPAARTSPPYIYIYLTFHADFKIL